LVFRSAEHPGADHEGARLVSTPGKPFMSKLRMYALTAAIVFVSPAAGAAGPPARPGLLMSYAGEYGFKPRSFSPSVDGSFSFTRVDWTGLTARIGHATATEHVNDCVPTCAEGHFVVRRVELTFTTVRPYHRKWIFTRFTDGGGWYDLPI
jgi:hypothetical protein